MIKKLARTATTVVFAGSMGLMALAPPAHAQAEGILCGFVSITDPTGEGDVQTGEVDGGPLTATSTDPNAPSADPTASLTLTCTIQVGPTGATAAGPDAASASASGTGAVVLPPTQISYVAPDGSDVFLCTTVVRNGVSYFYDYTNDVWSASSSVDCALAISQEAPSGSELDPILCPPLVEVTDATGGGVPGVLEIRPDGDVYVAGTFIWDCPPYAA